MSKDVDIFILMKIKPDDGVYAMKCVGVYSVKADAVKHALQNDKYKLDKLIRRSDLYKERNKNTTSNSDSDDESSANSSNSSGRDREYDEDGVGVCIFPDEYINKIVNDHICDYDDWNNLRLGYTNFWIQESKLK